MRDLHIGKRMAECILLQHTGSPCAICPACQVVRDALRRNKSATHIIDTMIIDTMAKRRETPR